ncbi:MinD/ParA family protein [Plantactinospora sp. BB1]|uniref:MinD/ParA family ATP-binding protein n=1 Tax=Plantactinospora sp. BB1 TaxID=2071627 RepID=UPI0026870680
MDGTETGWGRPAESAPRWRALLDRALHGGRTDEQQVLDERGGPEPPAEGGQATGRYAGNGYPGRPEPDPRPPAPGYPAGPGYPAAPGYGGAGHPGESRYAALEEGYRPDPGFGPGRPAEPGYRPGPGHPAEPGYRPGPDYRPGTDRREPGYPPGGYRPDPGYRPEPVEPYRPEPAGPDFAGESRYAALGSGYQPPPPVVPAPRPALPSPPPAVRRTDPPPAQRPLPPPATGRSVPAPRNSLAPPPVTPPPAVAPPVVPPVVPPSGPAPAPPAGYPAVDVGYAPVSRRATIDPYPTRQQRSADPEVERARNVLRRDLGSPRVVAFANPKGGVHKTTATVLGAATVGSVRGRGVLAWDDNELRGTLGLRAGSARHARTIRHLVADLIEIEALPSTQLIERLDDYLRHASDGSYDVLAGEESPRFAQRLDQHTVRRVLELLRRTHDVICVDTGNNVESSNWQTVLRAADQLVVTTVPREDAAFTADWMLDLLHDIGMGELADNAVTLLSCPTPGRSPLLDDLKRHFATRTRAVAVVPYDPALETGSSIEYAQLAQETRDAWLQAASMMLEPFAR